MSSLRTRDNQRGCDRQRTNLEISILISPLSRRSIPTRFRSSWLRERGSRREFAGKSCKCIRIVHPFFDSSKYFGAQEAFLIPSRLIKRSRGGSRGLCTLEKMGESNFADRDEMSLLDSPPICRDAQETLEARCTNHQRPPSVPILQRHAI